MSAQNERSKVVKTRITLRLLTLAALGTLIVAGNNCAEQREPECTSPAAGHFPTRLEPLEAIPAGCEDAVLTAMVVSTRSYYVLDADGAVDYTQPFNVAIQNIEMGEELIRLEGEEAGDTGNRLTGGKTTADLLNANKIYAYGRFTAANPDGNDQCYVPVWAPAQLDSPGLDQVVIEDDPETPDDDESDILYADPSFQLKAEWSDVTFLVSTAYPGVQFEGTVRLTRPIFADITEPAPTDEDPDAVNVIGRQVVTSCSISYRATGVSAVNTFDCSTPKPSEDPDAPLFAREDGYNQALCGANADFDQGIAFGAGINPDFPIVCDPVTKLCLLDGPFRSGVK